MICKDNHEYPIKIPRHPCLLLKRSVLCNCDIHAEEHSLLESIDTCPGKQSNMTIYYTVNTAFMPYLDTFKEELVVTKIGNKPKLDNAETGSSNFITGNTFQ